MSVVKPSKAFTHHDVGVVETIHAFVGRCNVQHECNVSCIDHVDVECVPDLELQTSMWPQRNRQRVVDKERPLETNELTGFQSSSYSRSSSGPSTKKLSPSGVFRITSFGPTDFTV